MLRTKRMVWTILLLRPGFAMRHFWRRSSSSVDLDHAVLAPTKSRRGARAHNLAQGCRFQPPYFQNDQLASHPGGASAHGSPGLANGGSCDAHAVYSGSTSAAGGRDFRDHAVWLRNWRRCHRLRRYCNRQGEASSGDQSNHSLLPNSSDHSDLLRKAHRLAHKLTARLLEDLR